MQYSIKASSTSETNGSINIKQSDIIFGTREESANTMANPAELFLGSFSACILKNVERFSSVLHFEYTSAEIVVTATRYEKPARMDDINYELKITSQDEKLNIGLLQKILKNLGPYLIQSRLLVPLAVKL